LDRQDSQTSEETNDEIYDDDDDVEYGQSRVGSVQMVVPAGGVVPGDAELTLKPRQEFDEENSLEISVLEKFK